MREVRKSFWFLMCVISPLPLFAEVTINEVAWMGTETSSNDEWIELYNSGSSGVSLDGWVLEATDGTPSISLSGSINGGEYAVLERTDDTSAPEVVATVIYVGALGNTGETLHLYNSNGEVVDTVDGSGEWSIGGEAGTFLTLQRTTSGWISATGTPGGANKTVDESSEEETNETSSTTSASSRSSAVSKTSTTSSLQTVTSAKTVKKNSEPTITPDFPVAGQDVVFLCNVPDSKTKCYWNFGDGTQARGRKARHQYILPGKYHIQLVISVNENETTRSYSLDVRSPHITIRGVQQIGEEQVAKIFNSANERVDISSWRLSTTSLNEKLHTYFPSGTVVLPKAEIAVRVSNINEVYSATLILPNGEKVSVFPDTSLAYANVPSPVIATAASTKPEPSSSPVMVRASSVRASEESAEEEVINAPLLTSDQVVREEEEVVNNVTAPVAAISTSLDSLDVLIRKALEEPLPQKQMKQTSAFNEQYLWWGGTIFLLLALSAGLVASRRLEDEEDFEEAVFEREKNEL